MTWWLGRLCEEFGGYPDEAWEKWQAAPEGFLEEVIEARAYDRARAVVKRADKATDIPPGALYDLVTTIELELAQEEMDGGATD